MCFRPPWFTHRVHTPRAQSARPAAPETLWNNYCYWAVISIYLSLGVAMAGAANCMLHLRPRCLPCVVHNALAAIHTAGLHAHARQSYVPDAHVCGASPASQQRRCASIMTSRHQTLVRSSAQADASTETGNMLPLALYGQVSILCKSPPHANRQAMHHASTCQVSMHAAHASILGGLACTHLIVLAKPCLPLTPLSSSPRW